MITIEKLKEFEEYRGYYDGFYVQRVKKNINLISDEEWHLLVDLRQDLKLAKKKLLSQKFLETLEKKVNENLAGSVNRKYLEKLVDEEW